MFPKRVILKREAVVLGTSNGVARNSSRMHRPCSCAGLLHKGRGLEPRLAPALCVSKGGDKEHCSCPLPFRKHD